MAIFNSYVSLPEGITDDDLLGFMFSNIYI